MGLFIFCIVFFFAIPVVRKDLAAMPSAVLCSWKNGSLQKKEKINLMRKSCFLFFFVFFLESERVCVYV